MRDTGPFGHLPAGLRHVAGYLSLQYVKLMMYMQGTGRHSAEEVAHFTEETIAALGEFAEAARERLWKKETDEGRAGRGDGGPFWILGGEKASEADFTLFGCLSGYLASPT